MTLNEQMKSIKKKANSRLKHLKKLASTSWGTDKGTLRQLLHMSDLLWTTPFLFNLLVASQLENL